MFCEFWNKKKGNVANQREHLILLLANTDVRNRPASDEVNYYIFKKFLF